MQILLKYQAKEKCYLGSNNNYYFLIFFGRVPAGLKKDFFFNSCSPLECRIVLFKNSNLLNRKPPITQMASERRLMMISIKKSIAQ